MKRTTHGEYLTQLTRLPHVFPVNAYLVREEDGLTLIDTALPGSAASILAAAQAVGLPIVRITVTHAHSDHVGSVDELHRVLPNAEVLYPERDARFIAGERRLEPEEQRGELRGSFQTLTARPDRVLRPGDTVGSLRVVASPGHTPGHIAFFDPRDASLIAGDAFQTRGGLAVSGVMQWTFPFPAMGTWHPPTAVASARELRALEPSRLAVGHGPVLDRPAAAMDRAIAVATARWGEEPIRAA